jgi:UDP-N-acetylglucosamine--N-acetylmuramyl-(pentapeptide) pyrophosphoryl-undecaprenol N-acetylglucosamine transferase
MALIARWVEQVRPSVVVVDVSVEVATFVRLLGVPVVVMAMPGERTDAPHLLVHQLADHVIAPWSRAMHEPTWLRVHADKTTYAGGISMFAGRPRAPRPDRAGRPTVLVLGGAGGSDVTQETVDDCASALPDIAWQTLGLANGPATADPWPDICAADVVVTHAGQGCIADVAAARRPAIVLPQPRPFAEQHATATALSRHGLAVVVDAWPTPGSWPELIARARRLDADRWRSWGTDDAAARAASAIQTTAARLAPTAVS